MLGSQRFRTKLIRSMLQHLLYWAPVPVPEALRFLFPKFGGDPILLQYALRVLEHHPVAITFFYVPQVVQALRTDELGYAERFIFETCVSSSPVHLPGQSADFSEVQVQNLAALLSPDYLEHEGERLPWRRCRGGASPSRLPRYLTLMLVRPRPTR